jgi:hypothetical protein
VGGIDPAGVVTRSLPDEQHSSTRVPCNDLLVAVSSLLVALTSANHEDVRERLRDTYG